MVAILIYVIVLTIIWEVSRYYLYNKRKEFYKSKHGGELLHKEDKKLLSFIIPFIFIVIIFMIIAGFKL